MFGIVTHLLYVIFFFFFSFLFAEIPSLLHFKRPTLILSSFPIIFISVSCPGAMARYEYGGKIKGEKGVFCDFRFEVLSSVPCLLTIYISYITWLTFLSWHPALSFFFCLLILFCDMDCMTFLLRGVIRI